MEENVINLCIWILENDPKFFVGSYLANFRAMVMVLTKMLLLACQVYITYHFYKNTISDTIGPIKIADQMTERGSWQLKQEMISNLTDSSNTGNVEVDFGDIDLSKDLAKMKGNSEFQI